MKEILKRKIEASKMNPIQKIALWWYRVIDSTGYIYTLVKSIHVSLRILFYSAFVVSIFFTLKISGAIIQLENYSIPVLLVPLLKVFGIVILYGSVILSALIVSYESILNIDVKKEQQTIKDKKQHIKQNHLQWYRLRNMNLFFRILVYLLIYLISTYILNVISIAAYYDIQSSMPFETFFEEFKTIFIYYIVSYVVLIVTLEYLARKKIKARKVVS